MSTLIITEISMQYDDRIETNFRYGRDTGALKPAAAARLKVLGLDSLPRQPAWRFQDTTRQ